LSSTSTPSLTRISIIAAGLAAKVKA